MALVNAMIETFQLVTLLGQPMLFTNFRIDRKTLPEELATKCGDNL